MRDLIFSWLCLMLIGLIVFYSAWSFAYWEISPSEWSQDGRALCAIVGVLWMFAMTCLAIAKASAHEE